MEKGKKKDLRDEVLCKYSLKSFTFYPVLEYIPEKKSYVLNNLLSTFGFP